MISTTHPSPAVEHHRVSPAKRLLIVLINWHQEEGTLLCLHRLRSQIVPGAEVLVIDNEGTHETKRTLDTRRDLFDHYFCFAENVGFTGACNFGLEFAHTHGFEFVLWFNNDAALSPGCIDRLLTTIASDPRMAMVSPVIRDERTQHAHFCGARLDRTLPGFRYLSLEEVSDEKAPDDCYLYGTALMARTSAAAAVSGFHSGYFIYWEDFDLSAKLLKAGYRCCVVNDVSVMHANDHGDESDTVRSRYYYYYYTRNALNFWLNNLSGIARVRIVYWNLRKAHTRIRELKARGNKAEADALFEGIIDGLRGRLGRWRLHPAKAKGIAASDAAPPDS